MAEVVRLFDAVRRGETAPAAGQQGLRALLPGEPCNGYWHGKAGLAQVQGVCVMTTTELRLPECPAPVAAVLHRLPSFPASLALATALNVGLAPQLPLDVSERLRGKRLRIGVRDARIQLDFTWDGRASSRCRASRRSTWPSPPAAPTSCAWRSARWMPTCCSSTAACPWKATPSWAWW